MFGIIGGFLLWKGFQGGEIFATMAGQCSAGLVGFLGGKMMAASPSDPPVPVSLAPKPGDTPLPVHETKDATTPVAGSTVGKFP